MENLGAGQQPLLEQGEAGESPEGRSAASHHGDTAASPVDSEDSYTEEATKATRSVTNRWVLLGALATVVLALVLATALRKRLPSVAKPPPVQAPEETGKKLPVGEEKPEELPLLETPGGPEIKPQAGEGEPEAPTGEEEVAEGRLSPEFKEVVDNIVDWARQQHTERPLSPREAVEISFQQQLGRNEVQYTFTSRFGALTPAYDPDKTADELKEELPELFKESIESEEDVRFNSGYSLFSNGFGDQTNGRINVTIQLLFDAKGAGGEGAFSTGAHDREQPPVHEGRS
ncbi:hypothetical protein Emed_006778 [Eimeria media]